jgi:nitric oxide reductase NorE protein
MTALTTPAPGTAAPEPPERPHLPGDTAMWVFVLGDLVIFGGYFIIYMIQRMEKHAEYLDQQQHLSLPLGLLNTLLLLVSSWFVATAVRRTANRDAAGAVRSVLLGGAAGVLFLVSKAVEWTREIQAGHTFPQGDFFMYYYLLTGVHVFHVLMGLVVLGIAVSELRTARLRRLSVVETCATYWHMVDLLWLVIFALLYVLR